MIPLCLCQECCLLFWPPLCKRDVDVLEQTETSGRLPGWSGGWSPAQGGRGWEPKAFSSWRRDGDGDAVRVVLPYVTGEVREKMEPGVHIGGECGRGCKLQQGKCKLDIRKTMFTGKVVLHEDRSLCAAVKLVSLETSKTCLDMALSNLTGFRSWRCCEQVMGLDDLQRCLQTYIILGC